MEGIEPQVASQQPRHSPPDHPAGERFDHERHVHEPGPGSHVGQVRHPQLVGSAGRDVALDKIGRTREQGRFLFSASREREPEVTRFAHRCTGERGAATERWLQSVLEREAAILRDVIAPVSSRDHREDEPWQRLGREKNVPGIGVPSMCST